MPPLDLASAHYEKSPEAAERDIKEEWLLKFGEVIFSIALGLSMDRFAKSGVFNVETWQQWTERARECGPLVILYFAFFAYVILYWYAMRMEAPAVFDFNKMSIGYTEFLTAGLLAFAFYQTFEVLLPEGVWTRENDAQWNVSATAQHAFDRSLLWCGLLILIDAAVQFVLVLPKIRQSVPLRRIDPVWRDAIDGMDWYYTRAFPWKLALGVARYLAAFCPLFDYPLFRLFGQHDNRLAIAVAFVAWNLALEFGLYHYGRRWLHQSIGAYYIACEKYNVRPLKVH